MDHLDVLPDVLVRAAEVLVLLPADAIPLATAAWDASAGVLPDVAEDAHLEQTGAGAEKSADPELDVLAQVFPASDAAVHQRLHSWSVAVRV